MPNHLKTPLALGLAAPIEFRRTSDLKPNPRSARKHPKRKIHKIAAWIKTIGWTRPIVINGNRVIVCGHALWEAAKYLGIEQVPTIRLTGVSEDVLRAYAIADNRLVELAGWDEPILAIELQHLLSIECDDLEITMSGFEVPEIDLIIDRVQAKAEKEDVGWQAEFARVPITETGDLYQLGKHKIFCGDARYEKGYEDLLGRQRASAVWADPPFNVQIAGNVSGKGAVRHREFAMASGEMTDLEFVSFLDRFLRNVRAFSIEGSIHYICIDWRHVDALIRAGKPIYDALLNICVWIKDNGGMGSFYRSQHEFVVVFRKGKGHRNNIQLGRFGRNRTNVWEYPGVVTQSKQGDEGNLLSLHPTVKPVAMVADAILDCTKRGEIILDPFLGSGTTLLAAERVGRICYGIEIDPIYVDVAIRRWQAQTGEPAVHVATGECFDDIAALKEPVDVQG